MEITLSTNEKVKVRELTAGDIFDCSDAAKTIHVVEKVGPVFVMDHFLLERLLLLKSVVSVDGNEDGPTMKWLRALNASDYELLQKAGETIDAATLKEVGERGRDSAAS